MESYGLFSNYEINSSWQFVWWVNLSLVELIFQDKAQFIIVRGQNIFPGGKLDAPLVKSCNNWKVRKGIILYFCLNEKFERAINVQHTKGVSSCICKNGLCLLKFITE